MLNITSFILSLCLVAFCACSTQKTTETSQQKQDLTAVHSEKPNPTIEYYKGKLYLKIKENTRTTLPPFDASKERLGSYPEIEHLLKPYGIQLIHKATKVLEDGELSKLYLIEFTKTDQWEGLKKDLEALRFVEYVNRIPIQEILPSIENN